MRMARITAMLILSAAIAGCAYVPVDTAATKRVSTDYRASGSVGNTQAFIYGNRTILAVAETPAFVMVRDETGNSVEYDRIGNYYRLAKRLDSFTAWINGRAASFEATAVMRVFSSTLPVMKPANPIDDALLAVLHLSARQLQDVRKLFPNNSAWLALETRYWPDKRAILWVNYPENSAMFTSNPEFSKTLVEAARNAEKIILRGRTDSNIAGHLDAQIARDRALAARKFLVENGVKASKIRVLSKAAGDFLVPNDTEKGRALNRRVEIEISSPHIEPLKQSVPMQGGFFPTS